MKNSWISAVMAGLIFGGAAWAQESTNQVATKVDWTVFSEENPKECWAVAIPKETINTRDGNVVSVRRGDIYLIVFYRPDANVSGQVYFTGGYPFAGGSNVTVSIAGSDFELFTENQTDDSGELIGRAWPASPGDDAKLVTAMKRGASATVTGLSSRGTTTKDTFSLLGFTAAVEDAEKRCAS